MTSCSLAMYVIKVAEISGKTGNSDKQINHVCFLF